MAARLGPGLLAVWARDSFEFVEPAVRPSEQRLGIGGRLHDALLAGLPHPTALLPTRQEETSALRPYRARGWPPLLGDLLPHGAGEPVVVLGRMLDAAR